MRRLLNERIFPALDGVRLAAEGDAAIFSRLEGEVVFTTDSFVVSPLFFPGGDIGKLCIFRHGQRSGSCGRSTAYGSAFR